MGASGEMDAEIPPDAREQCLRFKLRPAVRKLALYINFLPSADRERTSWPRRR